ncbi:MAG: HIT domain-containing protein [bacterium]
MNDCIFCKIVSKELPAEIIYEGEEIIGFENISPEAPVHLLFIPKEHLEWKDGLLTEKKDILSNLILAAKKIAAEKGISEACKFIFNVGKTGHILHIHLHLIGGWSGEIPKHNV